MKIFNKIPDFEFVDKQKYAAGLSVLFLLIGIVAMGLMGIRYGIDFQGGTLVQAKFSGTPPMAKIRSSLGKSLNETVEISTFGEPEDNEIMITLPQEALAKKGSDLQNTLTGILTSQFPTFEEIRRVESVGPKVGGELRNKALQAGLYALAGILLYISFRFRFNFAFGAVAALFHDVLITMGIIVILEKDFTLSIVAALLTIIGYSLNDTIVVFDRIRENIARLPKSKLDRIINLSINESLSRTILTSVTTFIVVFILFMFGGQIIHDFCFAMLIGLVVGTYSSIFVASPVMMALDRFKS